MEQQIVLSDFAIKINCLWSEPVQSNSLRAAGVDERLAMLQFDSGLVLGRFGFGVIPHTIVKDVAVLIDFDERRATVLTSTL